MSSIFRQAEYFMNNFKTNQGHDYSKVIFWYGCVLLFLGVLAFVGWFFGITLLSSFRNDYIPMAPATALSTMAFGIILISGAYNPVKTRYKWYTIAVSIFLSLYGFITFLGFFWNSDNFLENILFPDTSIGSQFPNNHMSPYTGLLFLLCGIAIIINILFAGRKSRSNIISTLGLIVAFAGFVAVLGYSFGTPFLYGGRIIPLAIPTSISFLLLGIALIGLAGPKSIYLRQFIGRSPRARILRAILPVVLSVIILEGLLNIILADDLHINPALLLSSLTIFFSIVTTLVVIRLTKNIFQCVEKAEREIETLRESEERFRSIFINSTIGIYRTSPDGRILMANPTLVEMLGYENFEELKKRNLKNDYYDPEYQRSDFIRKIEKDGEVKGLESAWKRVDNSILYVRESARVFRDSEGRIQYFEGMVEDITESKKRELEMQIQSEIGHSVSTTSNLTELMELIHHSLRKVVYAENCFFALYDENTGLFSFPYYVDQFDVAPQPLALSKSCISYVFHSGKSLIITPQVFQQLKDQNKIELIGSVAPSWIGVVLQISSRIIGLLVLQHYHEENIYKEEHLSFLDSIASQIANVIESRRANEALKKSEAELRESNATKDKFFSIISHDLKSPFNSIVGFSSILEQQVREKNLEDIEEYAKIIQNSSQRALDLLSNLLEWSRSQTGRMAFNPENTEIVTLITDATEILGDAALHKSITITKKLPQSVIVFADKEMIGSILRNLISNAIKLTNPGGSIVVSAEQLEQDLKVSVSDNGVGIQTDVLSKLFRLDESYSNKGTQNEMGTGLGLILCKEFIERHGGKIWVESKVGKGSKFSFMIPKKID